MKIEDLRKLSENDLKSRLIDNLESLQKYRFQKSIQQLEIKAAELFKNRQYSKVVFEITSETTEEERSAFLCNMLGLSKNCLLYTSPSPRD